MHLGAEVMVDLWRSENNSVELVLCLHIDVSSEDQMQVSRVSLQASSPTKSFCLPSQFHLCFKGLRNFNILNYIHVSVHIFVSMFT